MKREKGILKNTIWLISSIIILTLCATSAWADAVVKQVSTQEMTCSIWLSSLKLATKSIKNRGQAEQRLAASIEEGQLDYTQVGKPALPYVEYRVLLPNGFKVAGIEVKEGDIETKKISQKLDFIPQPISMRDYADPQKRVAWENSLAEDPATYQRDADYPAKVIDFQEQIQLGYRLLVLKVIPFYYNPVKGELRYSHHLTCRIRLSALDPLATISAKDQVRNFPEDQTVIKNQVVNKEIISTYQSQVTKTGVNTMALSNTSQLTSPAYYYVIVTPQQFAAACEPIRLLRSYDAGHQAAIVTLEEIPAASPSHPTSAEIKNYFQNTLYPAPPAGFGTQYILLVGDVQFIPISTSHYASDLVYTDFFNSGPQIAIGRIPSDNTDDIANYYQKIFSEGSMGIMISDGLDKVIIYKLYEVFVDPAALRSLWEPYISTDEVQLEQYPDWDDQVDYINAHSVGINTGHGGGPGEILPSFLEEPYLRTTLTPFYYAFGCQSAAFQYDDDLSEDHINHRYTYSTLVGTIRDMGVLEVQGPTLDFFKAYFIWGISRIGDMLKAMANNPVRENAYTLLGDPFLQFVSNQMLNFPRVVYGGPTSFYRSYNLFDGTGNINDVSVSIRTFNAPQWQINNLTYNDPLLASHISVSPLSGNSDTTVSIVVNNVAQLPVKTYKLEFDIRDLSNGSNLLIKHIIYTLQVDYYNHSPVLNPIGDKTVVIGETLAFRVTALDADGDPLHFLLDTNIPGGYSFNENTGEFSWTPTSAQVGVYSAYFYVDDFGKGGSDCNLISITARSVNPPVLAPIGNKQVNKGSTLTFVVNATDADGDVLTYSAIPWPPGANFNTETHAFSWTPDFDQPDVYEVTFTVSDGVLTDSESILINVNNANWPPVLNPIGNQTVKVGKLLAFTVTAYDVEGESLSFSVMGGLPSNYATFDCNTGDFSWTPGANEIGEHPICFRVSDGNGSDWEWLVITVVPNQPPLLNLIGNRSVAEGRNLNFQISASDPDGDTLTYSATVLPTGATFNTSTHAFNWTPNYDQARNYSITFSVSDGIDIASETIVIAVTNVNRPPVLNPIGNKTVYVKTNLSFNVTATDLDNDSVTFSATGEPFIQSPSNPYPASFTTKTGVGSVTQTFTWKPVTAKDYTVTFKAQDSSGAYTTQAITIAVKISYYTCFLGGTPILMADGTTKPIQKVRVGDKVIAFDEVTKQLRADTVKKTFRHKTNEYLIINKDLKVTSNHPVYSNGKWVEIGSLKVGDQLLNSDGKSVAITSITRVSHKTRVYNLKVNPYHTYIAGGIVVHNKLAPLPAVK